MEKVYFQQEEEEEEKNSNVLLKKVAAPKIESNNGVGSKSCKNFDHGSIKPASNVSSIFNCGSSKGKCTWFYPAKFFNPNCGVGKKYTNLVNEMEQRRINHSLWKLMPPILMPAVSLNPGIDLNVTRTTLFPRHNLTFAHVHKTGGTSLIVALGQLNERGAQTRWNYIHNPIESHKTNKISRRESSLFLDGAVKYQNSWTIDQHTVFSVVRDPAERFISAIGQATGGRGSRRNGIAKQLRKECIKNTEKETLRCFVNLVKRNGTWIELHFAPMVLEISFATMNKDIPVAIFPFKEVPHLLYEFDADPIDKKKDGTKNGFRASGVLTNMTIADYDKEVLRQLCEIYILDAVFLRHIGYETHCNQFL